MSAEIIPFDFEDQAIRVLMRGDDPWFVAVDVCRVLGIANSRDAVSRLDDDEVTTVNLNTVGSTDGIRGNPNASAVSESGLYALIFTSRKDEARRFRKWVTADVLPALRRTGRYMLAANPAPGDTLPPGSDVIAGIPECSARDAQAWLDMIREARLGGGRAAALRLWAQSPLPPIDPGNLSPGVEAGEGRACLAHLLSVDVNGGTVADWIGAGADDLLARLALRVLDTGLFVGNGDQPGTRILFGGTRWAHGGHRAALLAIPGARPNGGGLTLATVRMRGVVVPLSAVEAANG